MNWKKPLSEAKAADNKVDNLKEIINKVAQDMESETRSSSKPQDKGETQSSSEPTQRSYTFQGDSSSTAK